MSVSRAVDSWEIVRQLIGDRLAARELTVGPFLADQLAFPELTEDDVRACLAFARLAVERQRLDPAGLASSRT